MSRLFEVKNITKTYGKTRALDSVSIDFNYGITALLGPNGAGKTTLLGIICQLIQEDSGDLVFHGKKTDSSFIKNIGFMPQQQNLIPDFTVREFMLYLCALKNIPVHESEKQVEEKLQYVQLSAYQETHIKNLSGGMKQRLLIAQALLNDPLILIFDEPTAGLDPNQRVEIKKLLSSLSRDHIIITATHITQDVEYIADKVIILNKGKVIRQGTPQEMTGSLKNMVKEIEVSTDEVKDIGSRLLVSGMTVKSQACILRVIDWNNQITDNYRPVEATLEEVFVYLTEKENDKDN